MHDDRELLELAAKAAGYDVVWNEHWKCFQHRNQSPDKFGNVRHPWVPLDDDGDALRLAVKMGLTIDCDGRGITARKSFGGAQIVLSAESEYGPPDVNARMRRCIVRAAAAHIERGYQ